MKPENNVMTSKIDMLFRNPLLNKLAHEADLNGDNDLKGAKEISLWRKS